ncbi:MAG: 50S ribosomal protein L17 [Candidatus Melainabacteria bacterium]
MRHRNKLKKLALPADQRKALIRSLATSLFMHDQIMTTKTRGKVLAQHANKIVTLAKRGDLHAIRQVVGMIYNQPTGETIKDQQNGKERDIPETVLRRIFRTVAPRLKERQGGYVRVIPAPPRRGDAAPMALIQLSD